ncbi:MAG: 4-hydroxythreonine-4-phosphate dehydrogenase PdxA, partial [Candidatus Kapaibacteriota bacterium]
MKKLLKIGVTVGDLNGVGLEIFLKYLSSKFYRKISSFAQFVLFANQDTICEYLTKLPSGKSSYKMFTKLVTGGSIIVHEIEANCEINFGGISKDSGKVSLESIQQSLLAFSRGAIDCLVTLPICKEAIQMNNPDFLGQTEFIANYFRFPNPLMTFVYNKFRVALVTTHLPLKKISESITKIVLRNKIEVYERSLKIDFDIKKPKIALLGLNPHSGENGLIGNEEVELITPVVMELKKNGINIGGPFPADGFFAYQHHKDFDGIIACYHDQGLIPFKLISKGRGVNFTANLPIVRTSPDHGTAYDIAGKNKADYLSLANAIQCA